MLILLLLIIVFIHLFKHDGPVSSNLKRGYTQHNDSIEVLLSRIQWNAQYPGRVKHGIRFLFFAIILAYVTSIITLGHGPSTQVFLQLILIIWFILVGFRSYFTYHSDKFASYAIESNVDAIRKTLGCSKVHPDDLSLQVRKFKGGEEPWNFYYQ